MARRRPPEEPVSRVAIWARRLAFFAIAVMLLAVVVIRSGFFEILPALATLGASLALAAAAMVVAMLAFAVVWHYGNPGFGPAITAFFIGGALLAYPAYLGVRAYQLPKIADITTDVIDPPRFEAVARLRPRDANPVAYAGLTAAEEQRAAYPDIEPLIVAATPQEAYDAAMDVISKRKWRIVDARAPQTGRREGRIEAVSRSLIFGFRDDIVVRIREAPDGARVDIRSASRYGRSDFGANAARIRTLTEAIDDIAGAETPKKPAQKTAKAPPQGLRGTQAPIKR